jgi:hypothetical protein
MRWPRLISVILVFSLSTIIFAQTGRPNVGDKAKVVLLTGDTVGGTIAFIADTAIRLKTAFGEMTFARAECRTLILEKPPEPAVSAPVPAPAVEPAPAPQAAVPALPIVAEKKVITLINGDKLEGAIVEMTADAVTIRTLFGDIPVPKSNIGSIDDVRTAASVVPVESVPDLKPAEKPAPAAVRKASAQELKKEKEAAAAAAWSLPVEKPVPAEPVKKTGWAKAAAPVSPVITGTPGAPAAVLPVKTEGMSLAILPFANNTTDLAAGELARLLFALGMREKGYNVLDNDTVDAKLRELGISEGGQLTGITDSVLVNALQAEGLLYGTLLEAEYSTKAVSSTKKVTIAVRIMKNGQTFFSDQQTSKHSQMGGSLNPLKALGGQIVDKTSEKAFAKYHGHPLEQLIEEAIYKLQDKIPGMRVEKAAWTTAEGGSMFGTTCIPSFAGLGIGFRGWSGKKSGWGVNIQPSWQFNDITIQLRAMYAISTKMNSKWYLVGSPGYMWVNNSISMLGMTNEYKVSLFTLAAALGWEKLFGIRKNHGISFEGGLQVGSAEYKVKMSGSFMGFSMDTTIKDTYKPFPVYIGASYCYYFKRQAGAPAAASRNSEAIETTGRKK